MSTLNNGASSEGIEGNADTHVKLQQLIASVTALQKQNTPYGNCVSRDWLARSHNNETSSS
ncbi:ABC-2 type transport system ATP-binding protein [Sesbania bispinosa]|nr:ABC-2 type transport system ATP-binding protein [Sesbania bispinosa]